MKLDSTVAAVVTGGASGLGEATVRALAGRGVKVAIFDKNPERGEAVAAEVGGVYCNVDVASEAEVDAGFARARAAHGQERILVNCAGLGRGGKTASRDKQTGEIRHFPLEDFNFVLQVNLVGSFRCIAKAAAGMMTLDPQEDGDRGAIVNTASVAAVEGQVGQVAYSASKAGLVGLTLTVARDLAPEAIRINTIMPGLMDTPPMGRLAEHIRGSLAAQVPHPRRLGRPDEFAELALTMLANGYFNGETVRLDGAIRMAPR